MLVPIVFILALLLTLAGAVLENGLFAAKIALHDSVARSSDVAISNGVANYTAGLANYVKAHGTNGPWPNGTSFAFPQDLCDATIAPQSCPFSATIDARISGASGGASAVPGSDPALNLQRTAIGEERVSAVLTATISSKAGVVLGTRTRLLTYRVFTAAPYAIVSGSLDTAAISGSPATGQGDSGGALPPTADAPEAPAAPESANPAPLADTRIHVVLTCSTAIPNLRAGRNDQQAIGNDGLDWGNAPHAAYETPCHRESSPADSFADESWTSRAEPAAGWTH